MQMFSIKPANITQPIFNSKGSVFKRKAIVLSDKAARWRGIAKDIDLSANARLRLEWMIFYQTVGEKNAYKTAKHFNISAKTFYKWYHRFDNGKVRLLEELSRTPIKRRESTVTFIEECRIKKLRERYMHYGKRKIARLYLNQFKEKISSHKVQCVINKFNLYPNKKKHEKIKKKLKCQIKRNRIQKLKIKDEHFFLFHLDTIIFYWNHLKRYVLTATDHHGKIAYARMYKTKESKCAKDFLYRLHYLIDAPIANVQTDNGSEFYDEFEKALSDLEILHWFSRPRTPQDNSIAEKFNQTIEDEWINDGHFTCDVNKFNRELIAWLEEYNFTRPHQALDYDSPFEYYLKVLDINNNLLPMYSDSAIY